MSRLDHRFQRLAGVPSRTFPGDALGARATLGTRYMMESASRFKKIRGLRENFLLTRVNVWRPCNKATAITAMALPNNSYYILRMTKLEQIEQAIASLSKEDQAKLEEWWAAYRNEQWDRQIAEDYDAGRLDAIIAKARVEIAAGKTRPL
jgi:hypothetical protein